MNFKLDFDFKPPLSSINIKQHLLMTGSCFAEHIGKKLSQHKFNLDINPNGILFKPVSIIQSLQSYIDGKLFDENDLFIHHGLWYSWQHHGMFADADRSVALRKINASQQHAISQMKYADHLILTLGSAYVYELKETNEIVANCHKVPQQIFDKRLLSVKEIIAAFESFMKNISALPNVPQMILTVSPVRYLGDGLIENNHSKAILIRAVHELVEQHSNCYYFPSYEIVMDELRDYRFFEKDLVHPNELAIDYVWERFCETMFDEETKNVFKKIQQIISAKQHRPFHPGTIQYQQFLKNYLERIIELTKQYPFLDMEEEKNFFGESKN